jgi:hypothetical protein
VLVATSLLNLYYAKYNENFRQNVGCVMVQMYVEHKKSSLTIDECYAINAKDAKLDIEQTRDFSIHFVHHPLRTTNMMLRWIQ